MVKTVCIESVMGVDYKEPKKCNETYDGFVIDRIEEFNLFEPETNSTHRAYCVFWYDKHDNDKVKYFYGCLGGDIYKNIVIPNIVKVVGLMQK